MAEKSEIIDTIEALAVHFRPPLMSVEQRAAWMADWCDDLAKLPIEAIRIAARQWRQGSQTKFPTSGQFLPMVRAAMPKETEPSVGPWRPLSDAEYAALTLAEKIRHRRILAAEERRKAGPMFRSTGGKISKASGLHLTPEQMSDAWREHTRRAEAHEQEAAELSKKLREARERAA